MFRPAFLVLLATLSTPLAWAQATLAENEAYQAGLSRMEDKFPDLAIPQFYDALAAFQNNEEAQKEILLKIGEASVRAARMETDQVAVVKRAEEALEQLSATSLKDDESAIFWSAQASLLLGHFRDAADQFGRLAEARDSVLRNRSHLSRAHLLAAMGQPQEATALLKQLTSAEDAVIADEARLLQASLLLAQGKLEAVDTLLPAGVAPENLNHRTFQRFLRARLAQARKEHKKAIAEFRSLIEDPKHLGMGLYHRAILGLAESLHAARQTEKAVETLIQLLDKNPRTPLLEASFLRLLNWASTSETLKGRLEAQLTSWADAPPPDKLGGNPAKPGDGDFVVSPLTEERTGYALYYYALYLVKEKNTANTNTMAESLLSRLRKKIPNHPLVPPSLLETAKLQIGNQRPKEAVATLTTLEATAVSPSLKAEAAKLIAHLKFQERDFEAAAEAFLRVRKLNADELVTKNAGISMLRAGDQEALEALLGSLSSSETRTALQFERTLHQAALGKGDARPMLERFLREHQTHRRIPEARLAYAEEWMRLEPESKPAHLQVMGELKSIDPEALSDRLALRHLMIYFKLAGLTDEWEPAIAETRRFLKKRKAEDLDPTARLKIAEAYFNNKNFSDAQRAFRDIAASVQVGVAHDVALYFAAKAALKLDAEASLEEAVQLLQKVIEGKGSLANEARLELARSLIEDSPAEALDALRPLLTDGSKLLQVDALVLAAKAHRHMGGDANFNEAIKIYDRVLAKADLPYPLSNHLHSLKGRTYEALKKPGLALDTYYRVVNRENLPKGQEPTEWHWFTECAFRAVLILENGKRWPSALEILRKVEESGSPWSDEAASQRDYLQLKHQLFDTE
ncbi:MAG: tetratricopeptide repeat protein [Roseibacillus sp.]